MDRRIDGLEQELRERPRRWLVTGGAGFIGSHLAERLLRLGQEVVVLDDLSTGHRANLEVVAEAVGDRAAGLRFVEGDLRDRAAVDEAMAGVERVLHQGALGSVPRSMADPVTSHDVNVGGFLNVVEAARAAGVQGMAWASSSSVYGGLAALPARETAPLAPMSPYAATKASNEVVARGWAAAYGVRLVGLRYFNVVGARQDPSGAYAAVVPKWVAKLRDGQTPVVFGDGLTSRDFCPVANVVQANLLAAFADEGCAGRAYNVALGERTTLLELLALLKELLVARGIDCGDVEPEHRDFRAGDVRHSHADLSAITSDLGYAPTATLREGLAEAVESALAG